MPNVKTTRRYNAEQTRKDILKAAEEHFAEKGFYGARVQSIADAAAVNKRMIYEYYGDKEGLYASVMTEVYQRMAEAELDVLNRNLHGIALIEAVLDMYFEFLSENPSFVSLLLWENLSRGEHVKQLNQTIRRPTSTRLEDELRLGQQEGVIRKNLDVKQTVISLITMTFANFSNRFTLSELFSVDLNNERAMNERKKHTIDIIMAYICD